MNKRYWVSIGLIFYAVFIVNSYGMTQRRVEEGGISCYLSEGEYLHDENMYWVNDKFTEIRGALTKAHAYKVIKYAVVWHNVCIKEGKVRSKPSWKLDNIPLMLGVNTMIIEAEEIGGDKIQHTFQVLNTYKENEKGAHLERKDRDWDGLKAYEETYLGTSDRKNDTDGDGLTDYEEVYHTITEPCVEDTDDNGVKDSEEDFDGDGLSNGEEVQLASNPYNVDTDYDQLSDFQERTYQTNLNDYDSDDDLVSDGIEVKYFMNPLVKDTDKNGIKDGQELIRVEKVLMTGANDEMIISGMIKAQYLDTLQIREASEESYRWIKDIPGYSGVVIDMACGGDVIDGRITIKPSNRGEFSNLTIYSYTDEKMILSPLKKIANQSKQKIVALDEKVSKKYILINELIHEKVQQQLNSKQQKQCMKNEEDFDGDGLVNEVEQRLLLSNGMLIQTNPYKADTDGDGLDDGEEIKKLEKGIWQMQTHPLLRDTDDDGIEDQLDKNKVQWDVCERDLAMFAHLAYTEESIQALRMSDIDEAYFLSLASIEELRRWEKIETYKREAFKKEFRKSFAANVYKLGNNIVIAYRGTDSTQDWLENFFIYPLPFVPHPQAEDARYVLETVSRQYPAADIYVTGHSLGGYLGLYAAGNASDVHKKIIKVSNFNGLGMDYTAKPKLKKNLNTLQKKQYTQSCKIYMDIISIIGNHYAKMQKKELADEVRKKYSTLLDEKWIFAKQRHDMANFYKSLEPVNRKSN